MPSPVDLRVRAVAGPPVVAVRAWLRGGARLEAVPGVAWLTGRLLTEGTVRRDWRRIAEEADELGAAVWGFGGFEVLGIGVDALADDWERALQWTAELLVEPTFPEDRLRWARRQGVTELRSQLDQPEVRTAWAFAEHLYAPNPRGRPLQGGESELAAVDREACRACHREGLARGVVMAVAGRIEEGAVRRRLEQLLAGDGSGGSVTALASTPPPPRGLPVARREVPAGSRDQAHLYAGHLTVPRLHPDLPALEVLGVILGAGAGLTGRIPARVREEEGLAYTARAATVAAACSEPGHLTVYVGTAPATVERAETATREELVRLLDDGVGDEEVAEAKAYLLGREPFRRETARQWAELMSEAAYWGQPFDDPLWRAERLRAVDREAVEAAARRHVRPGELKVTVGMPG